MMPSPARSNTGKAIKRNHMNDLTAKSHIPRAKRWFRFGCSKGAKRPLGLGAQSLSRSRGFLECGHYRVSPGRRAQRDPLRPGKPAVHYLLYIV